MLLGSEMSLRCRLWAEWDVGPSEIWDSTIPEGAEAMKHCDFSLGGSLVFLECCGFTLYNAV